jgi:hypothetical protein
LQPKSLRVALSNSPSCSRTKWRNRPALHLSNDLVDLVALTGGGHIAALRFRRGSGYPALNPLWTPPWRTIDPQTYREKRHSRRYGPFRDGQLLCGLAGHNVCLDYFGPPSDQEAAYGLSFHGEAPNIRWKVDNVLRSPTRAKLKMSASLPLARLRFIRGIELLSGESVVRFTETIKNQKRTDHYFQWAEHVTLGPPFMSSKESYVVLPALRGMTDPAGYDEGQALLPNGREFRWPKARTVEGHSIDLSRPFPKKGKGFVTTQLLSSEGDHAFVAAVNARHRLMIAYVFRKEDFPWVVLWDENCAIEAPPWNARTQARAVEFSNSPFPSGRQQAIAQGELFELPSISRIAAHAIKTVRFCSLLALLPLELGVVRGIALHQEALQIFGSGKQTHWVHAKGIKSFLQSAYE